MTQNTVYSYPTISKLASHILALLTGSTSINDGKAAIEEMIEKYSVGLEGRRMNDSDTRPVAASAVVLLTGSSGNLGSQILAACLEDDRIQKIFAFNRPSSGVQTVLERHKARFVDRGLDPTALESSKLAFISGDASQPNLGLVQELYEEASSFVFVKNFQLFIFFLVTAQLRDTVTLVIHNAWRLDFNLSLSSFEPNIRGTRHLVDLVLSGPNALTAQLLFTSSVTSAQSWDRSRGPFPEEVLTDASVAMGGGYGEGKYVAERV